MTARLLVSPLTPLSCSARTEALAALDRANPLYDGVARSSYRQWSLGRVQGMGRLNFKKPIRNMNTEIGIDTDEVSIEGRMVELRQG